MLPLFAFVNGVSLRSSLPETEELVRLYAETTMRGKVDAIQCGSADEMVTCGPKVVQSNRPSTSGSQNGKTILRFSDPRIAFSTGTIGNGYVWEVVQPTDRLQ